MLICIVSTKSWVFKHCQNIDVDFFFLSEIIISWQRAVSQLKVSLLNLSKYFIANDTGDLLAAVMLTFSGIVQKSSKNGRPDGKFGQQRYFSLFPYFSTSSCNLFHLCSFVTACRKSLFMQKCIVCQEKEHQKFPLDTKINNCKRPSEAFPKKSKWTCKICR